MTTDTLTTLGAGQWTVPAGVYSIETLEIWGGGGSGATGNNLGSGGGGGGGAEKRTITRIPVTPGQVIDFFIGAGGAAVGTAATPGNAGEDSWFLASGTYKAVKGSGGIFNGAGGAGGTGGIGGTGSNGTAGGAGGFGVVGAGGAGGGTGGGAGGVWASNVAAPGTAPGGGGSGSHNLPSGAGARGEIRITYTVGPAFMSVAGRSGSAGADCLVTKPAGTVDDELLVTLGRTSSEFTPLPDVGTEHGESQGGPSHLWTKKAASEGADYNFVVTSIGNSIVVMVRVRGQDLIAPIDDVSFVTGTGALVLPEVTALGPNRLLLVIATKLNTSTWTPSGGALAEVSDAQYASASYMGGVAAEIVGAGPTGTRTMTPAAGGGVGEAYMLAIAPRSDGAGKGFLGWFL